MVERQLHIDKSDERSLPVANEYLHSDFRYLHHSDWLIYATDTEGKLYELNTETMPEWIALAVDWDVMTESRALSSGVSIPDDTALGIEDLIVYLQENNLFDKDSRRGQLIKWQRSDSTTRDWLMSEDFVRHIRRQRRQEDVLPEHKLKTILHKCRAMYGTAKVRLKAVERVPVSHQHAIRWGRVRDQYNKQPELVPTRSVEYYVTFEYHHEGTHSWYHSSWAVYSNGDTHLWAD